MKIKCGQRAKLPIVGFVEDSAGVATLHTRQAVGEGLRLCQVGAGHTFLIFLGDGFFPVNVLAAVRAVPEVCRIYCATANPTQVIVAETELGRGVLGVVDGASPLGVETDADIAWRKDLLRKIGYKL